MKLRKGQIFCFWKQMKIHTKRFTSSKSTVARILNKRCAEERYREDQVKARNKIAPPANVPKMLEIEPLLTRIQSTRYRLGWLCAPWTRCKQAGGRPDLHKIWSERDLDTSNMQCRGFRHLQSLSKHCSTLGLGVPVPVWDPPVGSAHLSPSLDSDLLLPQCHLVYFYNIFYILISIKR